MDVFEVTSAREVVRSKPTAWLKTRASRRRSGLKHMFRRAPISSGPYAYLSMSSKSPWINSILVNELAHISIPLSFDDTQHCLS